MSRIPKRPIEGSIVSTFDYMVVAEQDRLGSIPEELASKLHLYLVCQRPRIAVLPDEFCATDARCRSVFTAQHGDERRRIDLDVPNFLGRSDVQMRSSDASVS